MVYEKDIKGSSLCLLSSHPKPAYTQHPPIHTQKKRKKEQKKINSCPLCPPSDAPLSLLPHLFPLSFFFSSSSLFPPVLALSRVKLFSLFSLCEWTRPITSLFNEHVVFPLHCSFPKHTLSNTAFWVRGCVCV